MKHFKILRWTWIAGLLWTSAAWAGPRDFVVYAPSLGGNSQQARPYLETFLRDIEKRMGWPAGSASGEYAEDAKSAMQYIESKQPGYGLIAPTVYLDLACRKVAVEPLLSVLGIAGETGMARFHVVVKGPAIKGLDDLKGKRLASNHLQNVQFVSRVVLGGKVDAQTHFQLLPTPSPLKPFKQLDRGEADAALIDDAQLANIKKLPVGQGLRVVYSSEPLPPFPMVAFTSVVKASEREQMRKTLLGLCSAPGGGAVCKSLQITQFEALEPGAFKKALESYCKP